MAKIKSSRELAMERTARLKDDRQPVWETEEGKQYSSAAAILAQSYLQGSKELDQLRETLTGYPEQFREGAVQTAVKTAVWSLEMDNCVRALELIGSYRANNKVTELARSIKELTRSHLERLKAAKTEMAGAARKAELAQLKQDGICGSAIGEVNLQRSAFWKEAAANFNAEAVSGLEQLRQQLAAAAGVEQ